MTARRTDLRQAPPAASVTAAPIDAAALGRVGVLFGGRSAEREVSLMSGTGVLEALRRRGVDAHAFDPATESLAALEAARFDRVFIALHGRGGEDGSIQGVLETLGVPYTGSGVLASSMAMDKLMTKRVWLAEGLPTPDWREIDPHSDFSRVVAELGDALVVKPAREGSTFGISKVTTHDHGEMARACAVAAQYDSSVFAEQLIVGRELTVAILGEGAQARALPIVEIRAPGDNYDFHHKYHSDATRYLCPAPLDTRLAGEIAELALRAYRVLGARGWGRADVMLRVESRGDRPYLLELNTAPGMTGHSLVPIAARAVGQSYEDLVLEILAAARTEEGRR